MSASITLPRPLSEETSRQVRGEPQRQAPPHPVLSVSRAPRVALDFYRRIPVQAPYEQTPATLPSPGFLGTTRLRSNEGQTSGSPACSLSFIYHNLGQVLVSRIIVQVLLRRLQMSGNGCRFKGSTQHLRIV